MSCVQATHDRRPPPRTLPLLLLNERLVFLGTAFMFDGRHLIVAASSMNLRRRSFMMGRQKGRTGHVRTVELSQI